MNVAVLFERFLSARLIFRPYLDMSQILTIGYANRSIEELIQALREESVRYLIDVRSIPQSRFKPSFSAQPLSAALQAADIQYVHMGSLLGGRPRDPQCYENGHVIYSRVRTRPFFLEGIQRVVNAASQNLAVCLLCCESKPSDCHRGRLIGPVLEERGITVVHLDENGVRRSQAEVTQSPESAQGSLFAAAL